MNNIFQSLKNRISLRNYDKRDLKDEDLDLILEGAMRAPTAGNMMLYSIIVVKDEEKREKLSITCDNQPFIKRAPVSLIFLADMQRVYDYLKVCEVEKFCKEKSLPYNNPNFAGLFLGISDALIAAQNAVVAAESIGIGSCYIGDIMENYEEHKKILNLPKWVFPIGMLTLGYYPKNYKRMVKDRFDKKYIVFEEEYNRLSPEELKDMHKKRDERFVPTNSFGAENFGQILYSRKFGTEFFEEMDRSIRTILKEWDLKL